MYRESENSKKTVRKQNVSLVHLVPVILNKFHDHPSTGGGSHLCFLSPFHSLMPLHCATAACSEDVECCVTLSSWDLFVLPWAVVSKQVGRTSK